MTWNWQDYTDELLSNYLYVKEQLEQWRET